MTIAPVDSSEDLSTLVEELSKHTEVESMGVGENPMMKMKNTSMKEQRDCKNPIIPFLRRSDYKSILLRYVEQD